MNGTEKATFVNQVFDTIAGDYDRMNRLMTWGMLPMWQARVMRHTDLPVGGRGLDVCCGTGEMAFQMAKLAGPYGESVGVDFSDEMLAAAAEKQKIRGIANVTFKKGDALALPVSTGSFDAATCGYALRNVTDIPQAIREMARAVRPGGKVVCIEVSRPLFPPARLFFNFYYYKAVPWLGDRLVSRRIVGDQYSPYKWLAESLRSFPNRRTICRYYKEAGLTDVRTRSCGFGATTIYIGRKPTAEEGLQRPPSILERLLAPLTAVRNKWLRPGG